jgi:hypothetical protein
MKAREVLAILGISRATLRNYVASGKIKVTKIHNRCNDYDKDSVLNFYEHEEECEDDSEYEEEYDSCDNYLGICCECNRYCCASNCYARD